MRVSPGCAPHILFVKVRESKLIVLIVLGRVGEAVLTGLIEVGGLGSVGEAVLTGLTEVAGLGDDIA